MTAKEWVLVAAESGLISDFKDAETLWDWADEMEKLEQDREQPTNREEDKNGLAIGDWVCTVGETETPKLIIAVREDLYGLTTGEGNGFVVNVECRS